MANKYRLTLDSSYTATLETGYIRAVHAADFRQRVSPDSAESIATKTWREPVTGMVMLQPSIHTRDWTAGFAAITDWTLAAGMWKEVQRGKDASGSSAKMVTTSIPAAFVGNPSGLTIENSTALMKTSASAAAADDLAWAMQSKFVLEGDEAFAIHYHGITDEMLRKENWFVLQWDNIGFHFSTVGRVKVYRYDRAHLNLAPKLIEEFSVASPNEILGKAGSFFFLPIPGFGVVLSHQLGAQATQVLTSSANTKSARPHLVRWPSTLNAQFNAHLFERSVIRLALNPYQQHQMGFQYVTYPTIGRYIDSPFEPPYAPSVMPTQVKCLPLNTVLQTATAVLRNTDNTADWTPASRQARVLMQLTTPDTRFTPFVAGYGVIWPAVTQTRATTPLVIDSTTDGAANTTRGRDRLMALEFAEDEYARFEGKASLYLSSAAGRKIAERGETVFKLEASENGGTYRTIFGGFGTIAKPKMEITSGRFAYAADLHLNDAMAKVAELHQALDTAFDGLTVGGSLNNVLQPSGTGIIQNLPPESLSKVFPDATGRKNFKIGTNTTDDGEKMVETFLLFLRTQNSEFRLRHNWDAQQWYLERKPNYTGANAWTLTAFSSERNLLTHWLEFEGDDCSFDPKPPEANVVSVWGLSEKEHGQEAQVLVKSPPLRNMESLQNQDSPDFLPGGIRNFIYEVKECDDPDEIALMCRRVYDAIAHRRLKAQLSSATAVLSPALPPNTLCAIRALDENGNRATIQTLYLKRKTISIGQDGHEVMHMDFDDRFLGEFKDGQ